MRKSFYFFALILFLQGHAALSVIPIEIENKYYFGPTKLKGRIVYQHQKARIFEIPIPAKTKRKALLVGDILTDSVNITSITLTLYNDRPTDSDSPPDSNCPPTLLTSKIFKPENPFLGSLKLNITERKISVSALMPPQS